MPIFNHTFSDDKPIYYPSTWDTGKTAPELYEEWKLTTQYFVLSNLIQCVVAGFWLCFVYVVCKAIRQLCRLYSLDDNKRQKIENRQYISKNFLLSTTFIALIVFSVTLTLLFLNQFTRYAIMKGFLSCITILVLVMGYKKGKGIYIQRKQRGNQYQTLKKDQQQQ